MSIPEPDDRNLNIPKQEPGKNVGTSFTKGVARVDSMFVSREVDTIVYDPSDGYNVKDFGATGDGTTDDAEAIQAAIDAASGGGEVFFPAGTYLITDTLSLYSSQTISGTGAASVIQFSGSMAAKRSLYIPTKTNVTIHSLKFTGDVTANVDSSTYGTAVAAVNGSGLTVRDCVIDNFPQSGISLTGHTDFQITNNVITNILPVINATSTAPQQAIAGINVENSSDDGLISGNTIATVGRPGAGAPALGTLGLGIRVIVQSGGGSIAKRLRIVDNRISDIALHGIVMYRNQGDTPGGSSEGTVIANNTIRDTGLTSYLSRYDDTDTTEGRGNGIYLLQVSGVDVADNYILRPCKNTSIGDILEAGIVAVPNAMAPVDPVAVTGNIIKDAGLDGISAQGADHIVIASNVVDGVGKSTGTLGTPHDGIRVTNSDHVAITSNTIEPGTLHLGIILSYSAASSYATNNNYVSVGNNTIRSALYGVYAIEVVAGTISGNTFADCATAGMYVNACKNLAVTGNTVTTDSDVVAIHTAGTNVDCTVESNSIPPRDSYAQPFVRQYGTGVMVVVYGTAAATQGTWAVGDIIYDTAPSAGGNIGWVCTTAGTPGTWEGFGDTTINVKAFGATGDGTTDDRAAIQSAIDAADAAGGGEVFFPPGTYSIKTDATYVTVNLKANVSLVGVGEASILKRDDDAKTDSHVLTIANVSNVRISHLYFDGNSAQQVSTGAEIMLVANPTPIENIVISECSFNDFKGAGVQVNGSEKQNASGVRITGCRFISTAALKHFVFANWKAPHIEIVDNYFDGTSSDATANSIWVGNESNDALISGNYIYNSGDMGIEYFINSGGGGVISNNRIINPGTFGISVAASPNTSVSENHVDLNSVGTNGIVIESGSADKSDYCTVTGNVVENAATNGIMINKASYCTVSANVVKNSGDTVPETSIRIFADDQFGAGDETASYNQISNNVIHMGSGGIYGISLFCNYASSSIDGCQISDNILIGQSHASSYGVHITRNAIGTGSVEGNSVYNNRIENVASGVYKNASTGLVHASNNTFSGVTTPYAGLVPSVVNVKDFGATGDGSTDDTAAVQAAIDAVSSGGEVFFPAGTYLVSNTLTVGSNVSLRGSSHTTAKIVGDPTPGTGIREQNLFYATGESNIKVEGLRFDMRNDAITPSLASSYLENVFQFLSCTDVTIRDCYFERMINGAISFNATSVAHTSNLLVEHCEFVNGAQFGVKAIRFADNVRFIRNTFYNVINEGITGTLTGGKPMAMTGTVDGEMSFNRVVQDNGYGGSIIVEYRDARPSEHIKIHGNYVKGTLKGNNIKIAGSKYIDVTSNTCEDAGFMGIYVEGCQNSSVTRNYIKNAKKNSIFSTMDIDPGSEGSAIFTGIAKGTTTVITATNTFSNGDSVQIQGVVDSGAGDLAAAMNVAVGVGPFTVSSVSSSAFTINLNSSALSATWASAGTATMPLAVDNLLVADNVSETPNQGEAEPLGSPGSSGNINTYAIALSSSSSPLDTGEGIMVRNNRYIDAAGVANGLLIAAKTYSVIGEDFRQLNASTIVLDNNSAPTPDDFMVRDCLGARTTDTGTADIAVSESVVTVTPDVVSPGGDVDDGYYTAVPLGALSGSASYWNVEVGGSTTFYIRIRDSSHAATDAAGQAITFKWSADVSRVARGVFGKTT